VRVDRKVKEDVLGVEEVVYNRRDIICEV